jgi:D-alanine-D-alanine ligase-like ATP-grasp enzyme
MEGCNVIDILKKKEEEGSILKHIDHSMPKYASSLLNGYSLALEGWRRGLDLRVRVYYDTKLKSRKMLFTLTDNEGKSYSFNSAKTSATSKEASRISIRKELTKKVLSEAGVSQATGQAFDRGTKMIEFIDYAEKIGYPVVVKPNDGYGGASVTTNIKNRQQLIKAIAYTKSEIKSKTLIIVEKYYTGLDYRLYVVGEEVVGSAIRIPANVVGDGKSTIGELIEVKNKLRKKNNGPTNKKPLVIDEEMNNVMAESHLSFDTVLPKDELVFLKKKANVSAGGESIDVTDDISEKHKQIAVDATKAIKGLNIAAVDLLIDEEKDTAIVVEINTKPGLDIQVYPTFGQARDIPSAIIDYLFPDTKNYDRTSSYKMYFDFETIYDICYKKSVVNYVEVPRIPESVILRKYKFQVKKEDRKGTIFKLERLAHKYKVSGNILEKDDYILLVLAGSKQSVVKMYQDLCDYYDHKKVIYNVEEMIRTLPVKQGFHVLHSKN